MNDGGTNVVQSHGTSNWADIERLNRTGYLHNGQAIQVRFKVDDPHSVTGILVTNNDGGSENRFGVVVGAGLDGQGKFAFGTMLGVQVQLNGGLPSYPKNLLDNVQPGMWYQLQITIDDTNNFSVAVWQDGNIYNGNRYRYPNSMPAGMNWHFI